MAQDKAAAILAALGGSGNVAEVEACITRLRCEVEDASKVDEAALKSAGVQPVLMTLPPIDGQRYFRFISQKTDGGSVLRWLGDVGRIYRHQELYSDAVAALAFAEGVPLIDVRRQFLPQRDLSGLIAADGIHLTMSGYRCLFDTLADWVRARL